MANKIRKDGFVPAYITDEEYDKVMEMLIGGRKLAAAKAIDNLIDLVGDQIAAKAVQEIVSKKGLIWVLYFCAFCLLTRDKKVCYN